MVQRILVRPSLSVPWPYINNVLPASLYCQPGWCSPEPTYHSGSVHRTSFVPPGGQFGARCTHTGSARASQLPVARLSSSFVLKLAWFLGDKHAAQQIRYLCCDGMQSGNAFAAYIISYQHILFEKERCYLMQSAQSTIAHCRILFDFPELNHNTFYGYFY